MSEYRRSFVPGGTFFFTGVTYQRLPILVTEIARNLLRSAGLDVKHRFPFTTCAVCLLPNPVHCIWTLPDGDANYSLRWKDYIHYNPVEHGLVQRVSDWQWSSFHRYVKTGYDDAGGGGGDEGISQYRVVCKEIGAFKSEHTLRTYGITSTNKIKLETGCAKSECTDMGLTVSADLIKFRKFYKSYGDDDDPDHDNYDLRANMTLITHELGHAFEDIYGYKNGKGELTKPIRDSLPNQLTSSRDGLKGPFMLWQQSQTISPGEIFADMFVGWVYDKWDTNQKGLDRQNWMDDNMPKWIRPRPPSPPSQPPE